MNTGTPGRDASLRSLAIGMVLVLATWFSAAAALPGLGAELGLTATDERWAIVAVQIGFAVTAAGTALTGLADRVGPRQLALIGGLVAAAANVAPVARPSMSVLLMSRIVVGGALALVYPPLLKAAGAWARGDHGRVLGTMIAALTLGSASPHLVNGLGPVSWRALLWITSGTATVGAAVVGLRAGDGPGTPPRSRVTVDDIAAVVRSRPLRLTCLGYVGHVWELYAGWAAIAPLMLAMWGDDRTASLGAFAVVALGAAAAVGGGRLGDRAGRRRTAIAATTSATRWRRVRRATSSSSASVSGAACSTWSIRITAPARSAAVTRSSRTVTSHRCRVVGRSPATTRSSSCRQPDGIASSRSGCRWVISSMASAMQMNGFPPAIAGIDSPTANERRRAASAMSCNMSVRCSHEPPTIRSATPAPKARSARAVSARFTWGLPSSAPVAGAGSTGGSRRVEASSSGERWSSATSATKR